MKDALPAEKRDDFGRAVMEVALDGADPAAVAADLERTVNRVRAELNGKTAVEILARADEVRSNRREKQREQVMTEMAELSRRDLRAKDAEERLKAFGLEKSRFYFGNSGYSRDPVIELSVVNNTGYAVSRAYFHGVLATPGRSIPWVQDDFSYVIPGGIEPGESAVWRLAPNTFSEWGKAPKDRSDMVFTASVTRIDGADGESLLNAQFPSEDRERLAYLRSWSP